MSKIIRSTQIILGDQLYHLSADVTIPPEALVNHHQARDDDHEEDDPERDILDAKETVDLMLNRAQTDADSLLDDARQSADQIHEDALNKAKELYDNAKNDGYDAGFSEGYKEGRQAAQVLIDEALMIKEEVLLKKKSLVKDLEVESVRLVLSILEKMVGESVASPETIESLVRMGMSHLTFTADVTVRVSEQDYDYAFAIKDKFLAMAENIEKLTVKKDMSLSPGSCLIDSESGSIDVGLATQLERIKSLFEDLLQSE